ncbi:MAG: TonB-dependent receptor [Flavobacteriaceae bacterium]
MKVIEMFSKILRNCICAILMLLSFQVGFSQEDENIGTEVINVVKPYTPTISDAFKVKENPEVNDDVDLKKKDVNYTTLSVPVASTFTPSKGKAAVVEKQAPQKLYNNFASLAVGNYLNVLAELYATIPLNRSDNFTVGLNHHSTQGEIEEVQLDDKFYDTNLNVMYSKSERDVSYQIGGVFKHQLYNWYGTSYELTDLQRTNIDASHTYFTGGIDGDVTINKSLFTGGKIKYRRFWDTYEASENRVVVTPEFEFEVADYLINLKTTVDYLGGEFNALDPGQKYSILNAGIHPSYQYLQDDLSVSIGVEAMLNVDSEHSNTEFYVYPKITASYNLMNNTVIAFGGLEGGLQQNSYEQFVDENKYLAPNLVIAPTHNQFDAYLGLKGKLSGAFNYSIKGRYLVEDTKAMFTMNPVNDVDIVTENFDKANTFSVIYDDVNTLQFSGKLSAQISKNYTLGVSATYSNYSSDELEEVLNLPEFNATLFGDFKVSDKVFGGLNLFYVGERIDKLQSTTVLVNPKTVALEGYFDVNAHVGYHITNRFTAFLRGNNLANQSYQRWQSYPVQQLQVLGGLTYKFDF